MSATEQWPINLRELNDTARWFFGTFVVVITIGYLVGAGFVVFTTSGSAAGTVDQFRGNEDRPFEDTIELKFEKSTLEMLNIIHTHVTSFALIFFALGLVFLGSTVSSLWKKVLLIEPLLATLILFGGMALLRYAPAQLAFGLGIVMMIAGASTFFCVVLMAGFCLRDLFSARRAR